VLLDVPGGTYWQSWREFVTRELDDAYISSDDMRLVLITDDIDVAVDEVFGFYRNYHSLRFVSGVLVLRMLQAPTPAQLGRDLGRLRRHHRARRVRGDRRHTRGGGRRDHVELARLAFRFDRRNWARLRELDRLPQWVAQARGPRSNSSVILVLPFAP
jgi:hypothetical protein